MKLQKNANQMKSIEYKYIVYRDYVKVKSVIESCVNTIQLDNANKWACNLVDKWYKYADNLSFRKSLELQELIDVVCEVLNNNIDKKHTELIEKMKIE